MIQVILKNKKINDTHNVDLVLIFNNSEANSEHEIYSKSGYKRYFFLTALN